MKSQRLACYRNLNMKFASGKDQIVLDNIAELSLSRNIPIVDLDVATLITVLLRMRKARQIIELGTGLGYSSLLFSLCCPTASVLTIDRDGDCCAIAQNMFDQSSAHSRIHIVNSDILKTLKSLDGCYDFVFIDASKEAYTDYFIQLIDHLSDDAVVVTDDIYFTGEIHGCPLPGIDPEKIRTLLADYRLYLREKSDFLTTFISVGCGVAVSVHDKRE